MKRIALQKGIKRVIARVQGGINRLKDIWRWMGSRGAGDFFDAPADPEEIGGFLPISLRIAEIAAVEGGVKFKPLFTTPHQYMTGLQQKAAEALFAMVGAAYLPGRLIWLLKHLDAFRAVEHFLNAMRLDYNTLLVNGAAREFFNDALGMLLKVDSVRRSAGLSDLPLYHAIATHDTEFIERRISRLPKAAALAKSLKSCPIIFPDYYSRFYHDASRLIADYWGDLDEALMAEISETHQVWIALENHYDAITREIHRLVERIQAHGPKNKVRLAFNGIVSRVEHVRKAVEGGTMEPSSGIEALVVVAEDLRTIDKGIREDAAHEASKGWRKTGARRDGRLSMDEIRRHLKTLGLNYPDDLHLSTLQGRFRQLARLHHPDKGGDCKTFGAIHAAYLELKKHLEETEGSP